MELKRSEPTKVRIYGEDFELRKPDYGTALVIHKELDASKDNPSKQLSLMKDFVCGCGMASDFVDKMELDHVLKLVEFLTPKKSA